MDDGRARLIILTFGDPHLLKCAQGRQNRTTNPHAVLALGWSNHLDLHGGGSQGCEFLGHAFTNALEHGGAARQDHVGIKVFSDVNITLPETKTREAQRKSGSDTVTHFYYLLLMGCCRSVQNPE